jgi:hypothetical protein
MRGTARGIAGRAWRTRGRGRRRRDDPRRLPRGPLHQGWRGGIRAGDLVGFAHAFETVLDEVRADRLDPTHDHIRLFFRCTDVLSDLVRAARDNVPGDPARVGAILAELEALGPGAEAKEAEAPAFNPTPSRSTSTSTFGELPLQAPPASQFRTWRIRFAPSPELYAAGHEPLFLLRALAALGEAWSGSTECRRWPSASMTPAQASFHGPSRSTPMKTKPRSARSSSSPTASARSRWPRPRLRPSRAPARPRAVRHRPRAPGGAPAPPAARRSRSQCTIRSPAGAGGEEAAGEGGQERRDGAGRPRPDRASGEPRGRTRHQPGHALAVRRRGGRLDRRQDRLGSRRVPPAHARHPGRRDDDPRAAGEVALPAPRPHRPRKLGRRRQVRAPRDRRGGHRDRQDDDRAAVRSAHPHDPERGRPRARAGRQARGDSASRPRAR